MEDDYILSMPREQQAAKRKIRTFTGRYVNPLELDPSDIDIRDIAHHLSIINRYTGASPEPYSVAQHSVLGAHYFGSRKMKLAFLLHDSAEAYFNDLASPVKHDPRMKWYRDLEHQTTEMIYQVFGLCPTLLSFTKEVDDLMFKREVANWWDTPENVEDFITCWPALKAERAFLDMFYSLKSGA
jgi:uncharacterized protein